MHTLFKRSNGIYYILYEVNGKRKWKSTGKTQHAAALRDLRALESQQPLQDAERNVSLNEFVRDLLVHVASTCAKGTATVYTTVLRHFCNFLSNCSLRDITPHDADRYKAERLMRVSPVTVNIELRTLRAAFYTAERWRLVKENPFKRVPMARVPEKQPAFLSREDFRKLIDAIKEQWMKDLVTIAVLTGLRRGELLGLTWSAVDFARRVIRIESSEGFRTKHGRRRNVPMNENVYQILWIRKEQSRTDFVFTYRGRQILGSQVTHKFKRYIRSCGLDPAIHVHSLRHTFATWLVMEGVSIYEVQRLLGHASIAVTQVYSHLAPETLHSTVNKLLLSKP